MFDEFDDAFEVVEHQAVGAGQYCIRFRRDPFAGTVIRPTSFQLSDVEGTEEMKMDFDYDIIESPTRPADELEKDEEFQMNVARIVLNLYERTMSNVLEPVETRVLEDGGVEVQYDVRDAQPHGEVVQ